MRILFYVPTNRIDELKTFIRIELSSARFNENPYLQGEEYSVSLTLTVEDGNKLSILRNDWYNQEHPYKTPKKSNWDRILSVFNWG